MTTKPAGASPVERPVRPCVPAEDALKRAYYYTEAGEWRGPEVDEWDRWHAVAKVATRPPLSEGALMGVYMEFDRHADKTWPPAEYLLRFAAAVQDAVLKGPNVAGNRLAEGKSG